MHDAHLHLQDPRFEDRAGEVWSNALRDGVRGAICCGTHPGDWSRVGTLAALPGMVLAFGLHPLFLEPCPDDWLDSLEVMLNDFPDAILGEAGLDARKPGTHLERQRHALETQITLAMRMARPLVLHGAKAWGALLETLQNHAGGIPPVMLHGYSASPEMIPDFSRLGCFFSFNGLIVSPRARKARQSAASVPLNRLLIETDSPDMFPENGIPFGPSPSGRPLNQPANLGRIADCIATLRGMPRSELEKATSANFAHFCKGENE